jgi:hypothetical protein
MTLYFRQNLHVTTLSDLTAEVGVSVGFGAWVDGYGKYSAVPADTFTVDGLHVLEGQDGVQWADESSSYINNWAVTDWYIDGYIGSDTNDGLTDLTPIKTGVELLRRLGPYAMWEQSVTIHVLANGMIDALVLCGLMAASTDHLDIVGTPTVQASDSVLTFTNLSHATPSATLMTANGIADWTSHIGRRVRFTSGISNEAIVWVGTANPGGAGLQVAQITRLARIELANVSSIFNTSLITSVAGNMFSIETIPSVPSIKICLDGPSLLVSTAKYPARKVLIQSIQVLQLELCGTAFKILSKCGIYGCELGIIVSAAEPTVAGNMSQKAACKILAADFSGASPVANLGGNYFCCLFVGESQIPSGTYLTATYGLWQGVTLTTLGGSNASLTDCQFFDVPGAASMACFVQGYAGFISNISGTRNAGYGFAMRNNTTIRMIGTQNLQGTVSNGRLFTAPGTSLTLPQLLQPSDYAQKGTETLVNGTITVTVPWYDNTTQRVTVNHAVFSGTPGILSVQQISSTQFTITSSSTLDTSTVNWTISPLGRNIFISTV